MWCIVEYFYKLAKPFFSAVAIVADMGIWNKSQLPMFVHTYTFIRSFTPLILVGVLYILFLKSLCHWHYCVVIIHSTIENCTEYWKSMFFFRSLIRWLWLSIIAFTPTLHQKWFLSMGFQMLIFLAVCDIRGEQKGNCITSSLIANYLWDIRACFCLCFRFCCCFG